MVVGHLKLGESNGWPYSREPRAKKLYDVKVCSPFRNSLSLELELLGDLCLNKLKLNS